MLSKMSENPVPQAACGIRRKSANVLARLMENPGLFIVLGHRIAITLGGILNQ
jgi:hypothetical protein